MKIRHHVAGKEIQQEKEGSRSFILTNKRGGFALFGASSRYNGAFFAVKDRVLKVIEDIIPETETAILENHLWCVRRGTEERKHRIFMPLHTNAMVIESPVPERFELHLDVREPYDSRSWGRNYSLGKEGDATVITFRKDYTPHEDGGREGEEYSLFLAIAGDDSLHVDVTDKWIEKEYLLDKERGSGSFTRHVYHPATVTGRCIVFGIGATKDEALQEAGKVSRHIDNIRAIQQSYCRADESRYKDVSIPEQQQMAAYRCAGASLDSLTIRSGEHHALYAGLPWFFQIWGRDEAISLRGLMLSGDIHLARHVLERQLKTVNKIGRLPNRIPESPIGSADAFGWHAKRWMDLFHELARNKNVHEHFDRKDITKLANRLRIATELDIATNSYDVLAMSLAQETWMDSIPRDGLCIEIQALRLVMLQLLYKLSGDEKYLSREKRMREHVLDSFWNGKRLLDRVNDETVRPNLFLACYLYKELLSGDSWEKAFDHALGRLWLSWGGLATIDMGDQRYQPRHTGERDTSYHNGDSWFWINNLAAIVLHRINREKYRDKIGAIIRASTDEILWSGAIGHHAELSSAEAMRSEGCLAQAWSAASYIELMHEINGKDN